MRQKSVGTHFAEGPTALSERGSHRLEDYRFSHLGHGSSPPLTEVCPLSVRNAFSSSSSPTAASGRPRAAFHTRTCAVPTLTRFVNRLSPARTVRGHLPVRSRAEEPLRVLKEDAV